MNDLLLQQIEKISLIKHNRELIHALCGLDVEIRRTDGSSINGNSTKSSKRKISVLPKEVKCTCGRSYPNCKIIDKTALERVCDTFEPQTFVCESGFKKIVVPIVINDNLIGILFTGENDEFRFKGEQIYEITKLLSNFTEYVIKNELTPLDINLYANGEITRQQELLNRAVRYIKQNYHCNDLTLRDVSTNNGISYHYLSRIFKKELDTTFAQFRNKVRMDAAKKMLKNRRLSVSQISFACGFDDPAYFCKVFKNFFSVSPTNYRMQNSPKPRMR